MKNRIILLLLFALPIAIFSQTNLSQLSAPSAPAFTIMGVQPNEISKPKTLDALEASLYSNYFDKNNNILLPKNYALEFSPYWINPKRNLTFKEYARPSVSQAFKQNSSISLASFDQTSIKDSTTTNMRMGIGYRTNFTIGDFTKSDKKFTEDAKNVKQLDQLHMITTIISQFRIAIAGEPSDSNKDKLKKYYSDFIDNNNYMIEPNWDTTTFKKELQLLKVKIESLIDKNYSETNKNMSDEIMDMLKMYESQEGKLRESIVKKLKDDQSSGLKLEFATALVIDFPTNDIGFSDVPKWGVWLTPSYNSAGSPWHFLFLGRYIKDFIKKDYASNWDFGGKILYKKDKFSLSGEFIQRWQTKRISTTTIGNVTTTTTQSVKDFKAVLNINYELSDKVALTYSFGQNFQLNTGNIGNLISLLSLNYGLGIANTSNIK